MPRRNTSKPGAERAAEWRKERDRFIQVCYRHGYAKFEIEELLDLSHETVSQAIAPIRGKPIGLKLELGQDYIASRLKNQYNERSD